MSKKLAFGVFLSLLGVGIAGFFLPANLSVKADIRVAAPARYLYAEMNDLRAWPKWLWFEQDTGFNMVLEKKTSGKGTIARWTSPADSGRLMITESSFPDTIVVAIESHDKRKGVVWATILGDSNNLELAMRAETSIEDGYWRRWQSFLFSRRKIKRALRHQLSRLKEIAEAKPVFDVYLKEESLAPTYYVALEADLSNDQPEEFSKAMQRLHQELLRSVPQGPLPETNAFGFIDRRQKNTSLTYALPVHPDAKVNNPSATLQQHYSGAVVKGIHVGRYQSIRNSHQEVVRYIRYKAYEMNGSPWEIYRVGPVQTSDARSWITEICYPVKQFIY